MLFCVASFAILLTGQVDPTKGDKQEATMRARKDEGGEIGWPVGAAALKTMGAHRPLKSQWWKMSSESKINKDKPLVKKDRLKENLLEPILKENSVNTDTTEKLNILKPTLSEVGDMFDTFYLYAKPYSLRWTQNTLSTLFLKVLEDLSFKKIRKKKKLEKFIEKRVKMYQSLTVNLEVQPKFKHRYGYIVNDLVKAKILQEKEKYTEEDKSSEPHQQFQTYHTVPGKNTNSITSYTPSFPSESKRNSDLHLLKTMKTFLAQKWSSASNTSSNLHPNNGSSEVDSKMNKVIVKTTMNKDIFHYEHKQEKEEDRLYQKSEMKEIPAKVNQDKQNVRRKYKAREPGLNSQHFHLISPFSERPLQSPFLVSQPSKYLYRKNNPKSMGSPVGTSFLRNIPIKVKDVITAQKVILPIRRVHGGNRILKMVRGLIQDEYKTLQLRTGKGSGHKSKKRLINLLKLFTFLKTMKTSVLKDKSLQQVMKNLAATPGYSVGGPISPRTHPATSETQPHPVNLNRLNGPGFSVTVMPVTPLVRDKLDYTFTPFKPSPLKRRP